MRRRKMAAIIAPIPGNGPGGKWLCVAVDGNMNWKSAFECESEQDAKDWLKKTRKHWRTFNDIEVCHRLAPNDERRGGLQALLCRGLLSRLVVFNFELVARPARKVLHRS